MESLVSESISKHAMIDLETLGTGPSSAILSLGAVVFDINGLGNEFYEVIELESCIKAGLQIDANTVMWWMQQADEARETFNNPRSLSITTVLSVFSDWVRRNNIKYIWGNGSAFDNVILANAYKACDINVPWKYADDRCYRTLRGLYPQIKTERVGTYHNALDDAKSQALHLIEIIKYISK